MITKLVFKTMLFCLACLCCTKANAQSLKEKAEAGDMNAQYQYALSFSEDTIPTSSSATNEKEAFSWFLKAAEQGHPRAQNMVGFRYYYGKGVPQDYTAAFSWYTKSADQNNKYALYNLGICYEYGNGVEKSYLNAYEYYREAYQRGHETAKSNVKDSYKFVEYYKDGKGIKKDMNAAIELLTDLSDHGDTKAQYELANMYLKGEGLPKDTIEAAEWLLASAGGGGTSIYGYSIYEENEVNHQARKKLIELASDTKDSNHHYLIALLGCLYEAEGNFKKAEESYKESIDYNGAIGGIRLGLMYLDIDANDPSKTHFIDDYTDDLDDLTGLKNSVYPPEKLEKLKKYLKDRTPSSTDNCVFWLEQAIDRGYGDFESGVMSYTLYDHLLFCYCQNVGGFANFDKALETAYKYMTDENIEEYQSDKLYFPEAVVMSALEQPKHSKKALDIYKKIYNQYKQSPSTILHEAARIATAGLGKAYYKGLGTPTDYSEAFKYLSIAADLKDSESMRLLAACYRYGRGTKVNQVKEKYWLDEAVKHHNEKASNLSKLLFR